MAFASVQIGTTAVGTNSVAPTLPAASTAGTLLVACLVSGPGNTFTAPSGWILADQLLNATVFYYAGNPGGITTATFTATGACRGSMHEFSTAAGTTQVLDKTGHNSTTPPATSFPVTASGSSAAGDLGIAMFADVFSTATTGAGWTLPTGYTVLRNAANVLTCMSASYKLGLAAGVQSVTGVYGQSANQVSWAGIFAAFTEQAATALTVATTSLPDGKVAVRYSGQLAATGGTPPYTWAVSAGALPAGLSLIASGGRGGGFGATLRMTVPRVINETAETNWQALVGRPVTCQKWYASFTNQQFPTNVDDVIQACIDLGLTCYLCYLPPFNPPTTTAANQLGASLQAFKNAGLAKGKVVLFQEVEDHGLTPAQYKACLQTYEPVIHSIYPGGLVHDAAGSKHLLWQAYFPATLGVDSLIDEYGIDFYANTYASGTRLDAYAALVAATGKRLGVMEMGSSIGTAPVPPDTGPGSVTAYFGHVTDIAAANPPGSYMWYTQDNRNVHNIISDPADFRIPLLQALSDTVAGTSASGKIAGTPTTAGLASFTAKVTDNNAATATAALTINVTGAAPPVITTLTLPAATTGVAYSQQVAVTGGTAPLTFTLTAGAVPDGLALDAGAGLISGTPTAAAATSGFTVTVTDGNGQAASQALFITVVAGLPPPVPAPNPLGFPQVVIEAGLLPAAPQVPAGTFILDDPVYGKLDSGNQLADTTAWTDIAAFFRSGSISRPSTRVQGPLITYQGGTASGVFDNSGGQLDPDNPSGPFYGALRPMIPVRIRAVYGSASYPMWSGFISSWAGADLTYDMGYDEATLTADDGFKVLAGITIPAVPLGSDGVGDGDGEDSGARITRILNAAGWYTDHRRVDTGDSPLQGTLYGDTALNLLQLTTDSEIGSLYIDGAGNVVYRHRQAILEDARSTQVQAVFGDLPSFTVLTADSMGFEGGRGTWTGAGNCNLSATSAAAHTGTGALQLSSIAAGDMTAAHCTAANITTQGLPVTPGQPVACAVWALSASAPRTVQAGAQFYNAAGTVISTLRGPAVTDSTSGWVQATASLTAPASAAFCRLSILVQATGGAAEIHYLDDAQLYYPELACTSHRRAHDDTTLANDIQATSAGGTLQEAESLTSQRAYLFPRTYARTDLLLQDDPTTLAWAQWVLSVSLSGDDRFDAITIDPIADPANLFPQVLAREIGDRIQVWRRPQNSGATISQDCFIRGIQHDLDAVNGTWSTTWTLQSAARYTGFLILDNPVTGLLNTGKLAF